MTCNAVGNYSAGGWGGIGAYSYNAIVRINDSENSKKGNANSTPASLSIAIDDDSITTFNISFIGE